MASEESAQTQDVQRAADGLASRLEGLVAEVQRSNRTTIIVGIILAVVIALYMHLLIVNRLEKYIKEPDTIAALIRTSAQQQIPELINELRTSLRSNAQQYVADGRKALMTQVPKFRKNLEKRVVNGAAKEMRAVLQGGLDKIVDDMIKNQKDKLDPLIAKAADDEGVSILTDEFEKLFEEGLGEPLKARLDKGKYVKRMKDMAAYLRRLRTAKDLRPKEEYEKELLTEAVATLARIMKKTVTGDKAVPAKAAK